MCAIWIKHGKGPVNDYVHPWYSTTNYLKTYGGSIKALVGPSEWPKSHKEPPLPPLYTRKPGRPKKLRKKGSSDLTKDGTHINRSLLLKHCSKCKEASHNSRRCPKDPIARKNGNFMFAMYIHSISFYLLLLNLDSLYIIFMLFLVCYVAKS